MSEANFEERAIELAERLERITANAAPELAGIALESAKLDVASSLISSGAGLLVGLALLGVACWLFKRMKTADYSSQEEVYGIGMILSGLIGGLVTIACFFTLVDPVLWVSLGKPELWIAKQVLGL